MYLWHRQFAKGLGTNQKNTVAGAGFVAVPVEYKPQNIYFVRILHACTTHMEEKANGTSNFHIPSSPSPPCAGTREAAFKISGQT